MIGHLQITVGTEVSRNIRRFQAIFRGSRIARSHNCQLEPEPTGFGVLAWPDQAIAVSDANVRPEFRCMRQKANRMVGTLVVRMAMFSLYVTMLRNPAAPRQGTDTMQDYDEHLVNTATAALLAHVPSLAEEIERSVPLGATKDARIEHRKLKAWVILCQSASQLGIPAANFARQILTLQEIELHKYN